MAFHCGFDIIPPLNPISEDLLHYSDFIDKVVETYHGVTDEKSHSPDKKVLDMPNEDDPQNPYITFMVGEGLRLPCSPEHCGFFRRFSTRTNYILTGPTEKYIRGVADIAIRYFGERRAMFWHEFISEGNRSVGGFYTWDEVDAADRELKEQEIGHEGYEVVEMDLEPEEYEVVEIVIEDGNEMEELEMGR